MVSVSFAGWYDLAYLLTRPAEAKPKGLPCIWDLACLESDHRAVQPQLGHGTCRHCTAMYGPKPLLNVLQERRAQAVRGIH